MGRVVTLLIFVVCAAGVAAAAGQPQGTSTASKDVTIKSFTLTASDGVNKDNFGYTVAIDGDTAVVGSPFAEGGKGAAYVFVRPPSGWADMKQTAILTASDGQVQDYFGSGVAISGDTIIVGAFQTTVNGNLYQGAGYVFSKPAGGWANMTENAKLTASDGISYDYFGFKVAIDANTAVIGAPKFDGNHLGVGAAYVFVKQKNSWTNTLHETAKLTASDGAIGDDFGYSVSMASSTIVVGAPFSAGNGGAYVFVKPPNGWVSTTQTAKLTSSNGKGRDFFGLSVAVNGDTVAVGAPNYPYSGRAYVFVEPTGGWVDMTQTAGFKDGISQSFLGWSISLYGKAMLVGAYGVQFSTGAAFLFTEPLGGWRNSDSYRAELSVPFQYPGDFLGQSVSISGNTALVGANAAPTFWPCQENQCQDGPGEAFIFTTQ